MSGTRTGTERFGRFATRAVLVGVPLTFISIFFLYPVASIIWRGLNPDGQLSFDALGDILTDGDLRSVAWFTFWQASAKTSTIIYRCAVFIKFKTQLP